MFVRLTSGEILLVNDENELMNYSKSRYSNNILDLLEEEDLVRIEYFSLRHNKRITRLFIVDEISDDRHFITINNGHMHFLISENDFLRNDKKLEPVIVSFIPREKLLESECNLKEEKEKSLKL